MQNKFKALIGNSYFQNAITCFLFLTAGGIVSLLLKNEFTYDFLLYHYYNGFAFVHSRYGIDLAPAFLPSFYNPLLDGLTYAIIRFCADNINLYHFISGLSFGLLIFVFYKISLLFFDFRSLKGKIQVLISIMIAATGFNVWSQIGTCSHDISSAIFVLAAFYFLLQKDKKFLLAGFLLGTAAALKLTNAIYCVSCGLTLFFMFKKLPHPSKNILTFVIGGFIGFVLFNGFWNFHLWKTYQNPFFPFWNALFKSPYYPFINYSDRLTLEYLSLSDAFLLPFYLIIHVKQSRIAVNADVSDFRLAFLFLTGISFLIFYLKNKKPLSFPAGTLALLTVVSYIVWLLFSAQTRFLVPVEMCAAVFLVKAFSACRYPETMIKEALYWSSLIFLLFLLFSTPYYSDKWGTTNSYRILSEKILLPENTLVLNFGELSPALAAQLIEDNPSAKAVGILNSRRNSWKQWDVSGFGKNADKKRELIQSHPNKVAVIFEPFYAAFIPPIGEKAEIINSWICEPLSVTDDYSSFSFKFCFPPEMKEKITFERK